jgi:hypothetical protein
LLIVAFKDFYEVADLHLDTPRLEGLFRFIVIEPLQKLRKLFYKDAVAILEFLMVDVSEIFIRGEIAG